MFIGYQDQVVFEFICTTKHARVSQHSLWVRLDEKYWSRLKLNCVKFLSRWLSTYSDGCTIEQASSDRRELSLFLHFHLLIKFFMLCTTISFFLFYVLLNLVNEPNFIIMTKKIIILFSKLRCYCFFKPKQKMLPSKIPKIFLIR